MSRRARRSSCFERARRDRQGPAAGPPRTADSQLYSLRGRRDYFQGYMVPSTGCLRYFALHAMPTGLHAAVPAPAGRPTEMAPITPYPKLFAVFEAGGALARPARHPERRRAERRDRRAAGCREISLVAEALHEAGIARSRRDRARAAGIRVVLIAGPSLRPARRRSPSGWPCNCSPTECGRCRSAWTTTSWIATRRRATRSGEFDYEPSARSISACSTSTC